jgi:hypothetical protein
MVGKALIISSHGDNKMINDNHSFVNDNKNIISRLGKELPSIPDMLPDLKQVGGELKGPCPICGEGEDRFSVKIDEPKRFFCRHCKDNGRGANGNGSGDNVDVYMALHGHTNLADLAEQLGITINKKREKAAASAANLTATYTYTDENGTPLYCVERFEQQGFDKNFRQYRMDSAGNKVYQLGDVRRVPYNLPALLGSDYVILVEGEKDANRLIDKGLVATCFVSSHWRDNYAELFAQKKVYLLPDNDDSGRRYASRCATGLLDMAAEIKIVDLPGLPENGDVSDWLDAGGSISQLRKLVEEATIYRAGSSEENDIEAVLQRLAGLTAIEYEKVRMDSAKKLGIRVTALDEQVKALRKQSNSREGLFEELEACPDKVDGAALLDSIKNVINEHLILADDVDVPMSLWVLLTYCFNDFPILPILGISSPEKRCGKTTALEVLHGLVHRPLPAASISAAAVFRVVESHKPTLLIDEADTFLTNNDELRGVINSGHTRTTAFTVRCNSETNEPERFSTWAPKVLAMIGNLPDTIKDRSIVVRMERKLPSDKVKRVDLDFHGEMLKLRERAFRWCLDNSLRGARPNTPEVNNDRALDNWLPLLAIADRAGGDWPKLAREAMVALEDVKKDSDNTSEMLLSDIRDVLSLRRSLVSTVDRIKSEDLVHYLCRLEGRPWPEWRNGRPMTANALAKHLGKFRIKPKTMRFENVTAKGYAFEDFDEAFERYLSPPPYNSNRNNVTSTEYQTDRQETNRNTDHHVTDEDPPISPNYHHCYDVTDEERGAGKDRDIADEYEQQRAPRQKTIYEEVI